MRKAYIYIFDIVLLLVVFSCKDSTSNKIMHLVNEWQNREIIYPTQLFFTVLGKDTISAYPIFDNKYSIVTYVDSIGCTSCKLQLRKWRNFITELDSLTNSSVPVYFFLHPKKRDEVVVILNRNQFNYPVCIDENDSLNLLNHFPQDMSFQTFLLDKDNKVIAIGNPVLNPKIRDLYFNILFGKNDSIDKNKVPSTNITVSELLINMGDFSWNEKQEKVVLLKNIGNSPFVINEIITSCGCVDVDYDKKPVSPKDSTSIKIEYQAEYPEHFSKTVTIYCNAEGAPFELKVSGNAK